MNTTARIVLGALGALVVGALTLAAFAVGLTLAKPAPAVAAPAPVTVVLPPPAPTTPVPVTVAPLPTPRALDGPTPPTSSPAPTAPAVPTPAPDLSSETRGNQADAKASGLYGNGTYLVGKDIEPGDYWTRGPDMGDMAYWARLSNTSGDMDSIIANGTVTGPTTITISASDHAVEFSHGAVWTKRS